MRGIRPTARLIVLGTARGDCVNERPATTTGPEESMTTSQGKTFVVATGVFILALVGESFSDAIAQNTKVGVATQPVKIKLGWQKVPPLAPNYLMAQEAKKYGLDIELVEFNRYTDMRVALENGSIDFGSFGPGDMALSADTGRSNAVALAG